MAQGNQCVAAHIGARFFPPPMVRAMIVAQNFYELEEQKLPGMCTIHQAPMYFSYKVIENRNHISPITASVFYKYAPNSFQVFRDFAVDELAIPQYAEGHINRYLPTAEFLPVLLRGLVGSVVPFNIIEGRPSGIIAAFSVLFAFNNRYREYLEEIDQGAAQHTLATFPQGYPEYQVMCGLPPQNYNDDDDAPEIAPRRSSAHINFIIHSIALTAFKNFNNDNHLNEYMRRRIAAYSASCANYEITEHNWQLVINAQCLMVVSRTLNQYPLLRRMLFSVLIAHPGDTFTHTKNLLSFVGLTSAQMISRFIATPQKTKAHIHLSILRESLSYLEVWTELAAQWGEHVKYFRILAPGNTQLDIVNWPNLAYVSYLMMASVGGEAVRQYQFNKSAVTVMNIPRLLASYLPEGAILHHEGLQGVLGTLRAMNDQMRDALGINVDALNAEMLDEILRVQPEADLLQLFGHIDAQDRRGLRPQIQAVQAPAPAPPAN